MTTTMNDTMTIGTQLVELCRAGKNVDAVKTLYAPDAVSIEPAAGPGCQQVTTGRDGILAKNESWVKEWEVHSSRTEGPYPHEDRFIVFIECDATCHADGPMKDQRMQMQEMGLYTVADGKIVKEEFFYDMSGACG